MAGACIINADIEYKMLKVKWSWTSTSGGAVSGEGAMKVSGEIVGVHFIPGTGGDAPSNLYDVKILDANSVDILAGAGADCGVPISDTDRRIPQKITLMDETLTPVIANAGDTKSGVIELFLKTA